VSAPRLRPPRGGTPPPATATLADGTTLELRPLAKEICARYRREFPDEESRYGSAGVEWCIHDNQHILNWAALEAAGVAGILERQLGWLARVLAARDFPLERLRRDVAIAAGVVRELHPESSELAEALESASAQVAA
jgi:hypothetical protein